MRELTLCCPICCDYQPKRLTAPASGSHRHMVETDEGKIICPREPHASQQCWPRKKESA